jgi:hypothetical protein
MANNSTYTPALGAKFCAAMASTSDSISTICKRAGMPSKATVFRWRLDFPEFKAMYDEAKSDQVDSLFDEIPEIADKAPESSEGVAKAKLRIYARIETAQRLKPKQYGNKVTNEMVGADGGPIEFTGITRRIIKANE